MGAGGGRQGRTARVRRLREAGEGGRWLLEGAWGWSTGGFGSVLWRGLSDGGAIGPIPPNTEGEGSVLPKGYFSCGLIPWYWLLNTNSQFHGYPNNGIRYIQFQFSIPGSSTNIRTEPI